MSRHPRSGRRPGATVTRDAIESAARRKFAELGYERTTIRTVAADAGVDPSLVMHFFGTKQRLFLAVMTLPFDPREEIPRVLAGLRRERGLRFAEFIVGVLEDDHARDVITAMVRAAASEPEAARMLRELVEREILRPLAESLDADAAEIRAALVGSQVVGLVMARYVVGVEPLAALAPDAVVAALAPTFQRYLAGALASTRR